MSHGEEPGQGHTGKKRKAGFLVSALLVLVLLGVGVLAGGFFYSQYRLTTDGPVTSDGEPRIVTIPRGATVARMANELESIGAIDDEMQFRLAARYLKATTSMKAGEYAIPSGASLKEIVQILSDGKSILHPITIPEGLTTQMVLSIIASNDVLTGEMPDQLPAEGALLPDTYLVHRGETRQDVINRMQAASRDVLDAAWETRQKGLPLESKQEALILASIVEKETALAEERPRIAAVFINRLRFSMRLRFSSLFSLISLAKA